jgi:HAD superfamily hydrolase (TIGR01509 family)
MTNGIDAVLFDLGDTLMMDAAAGMRRLLAEAGRPAYDWLRMNGFTPPPYTVYVAAVRRQFLKAFLWSRIIRREANLVRSARAVHRRMGMVLDDAQLREIAWRCTAPLREFFVPDEDARRVLERLHGSGLKLGVVSNTMIPGFAMDEHLRRERLLEYLPIRVYSSDVGYRKPHRRIYSAALERIGAAPERTVFVGDRADNDVWGPSRLGMRTVLFVRNGHSPRRARPDHVIRSLSEIPAVIGLRD